ncbi:hypothetical protein KIW84_011641 [Lathyrus oleraceus]|uniref:Protein FAR1-RELATED SEQUENCE n=1 Tax=Pisum sativum TaxID=3888 RepID=A0A9D5BFH3_PEA|nr:hypothetical protein KIW84_011641 [Pisum sativum]
MKAIEVVFPNSINLLCRFHINKNVGVKCKQHVVNDLQKTIDTLWMEVVWASDEVEYGQRLHQLEQACVDYSGFINYVKDTWLTPHRHRFVGAWINRVLHLGNTTTNRVESAHWKLKQMLEVGEDDGSEVDMTAAMDELWRRFRSLDVIGKRALRSRVCELAYPTMTTLCPPPEKIKTKGGVKKKGKKPADYDFYRDPSYHEYVDKASQSSQRQSQPSQTSKKIKLSKKQPQFILQFPNHIRSYIEDVVNVESDVRESLMIESYGSQPPEKWMSLPDMGYLIANRYNVVLVCLGNPCITFFPMTSSHSSNVSIYCIGFVNHNHWVQVNMKEGFPLPPVTLDWKKFRSHIATTWMLGFAGRMQHWQLLTPVLA